MKDLKALKYLLTEDIYLIPEPETSQTDKQPPTASESEKVSDEKEKTGTTELKFKGNKNGSLLVLVNNRDHEFLDKSQEELLQKIIKAISISENNMILINTAHQEIDDVDLHTLPAKKVLQFFLDHNLSGDNIPPYTTVIDNGKTRLISDPLDDLIHDLNKKKVLWNALQKSFIES